MKKILQILTIMLTLSLSSVCWGVNFWGFSALTGGGTGALDKLSTDDLGNGDMAIGVVSNYLYSYTYDSTSSSVHDGVTIIAPLSGIGRWLISYPYLSTTLAVPYANALSSQYVDWNASSGGSSIANKPDLSTYQPLLTNPIVAGTLTTGQYCSKNAASNTIDCNTSASALLSAIGAAPVASPTFTGTTTAPALTLSSITGSTQCLHVNSSGVVSGAGSDCGTSGGSGANANGYYWVSQITDAPANAVNIGALTTGLLKITVSGSVATPTTATSGTDYLAPFGSQTANYFYAAPDGSSGTPSFRAIVAGDLPATITSDTSGNATTASSATTATQLNGGAIPVSKTVVGTNASGQIIDASTTTLSNDTTGNAATATTATKLNGGTVPTSKTIVGTNASGQLIDATSSTLTNNTTGTAANLSGTPTLPNGTAATTQSASDDSTKLATTAFVQDVAATVTLSKASPSDVITGTDNSKYVTSYGIKESGTVVNLSCSEGEAPIWTSGAWVCASPAIASNVFVAPTLYGTPSTELVIGVAPTERTTTSTTYIKLKQITVKKAGTYIIRFQIKNGSSSGTTNGRIYKNGVATGTERTSVLYSVAYTTFSEALTLTANDQIQIYIKTSNASYPAYVKDFSIQAHDTNLSTIDTD